MSNMVIDPGKHKEKYLNWKSKIENSEIEGISKENSKLIKEYVFDMESGLNVANNSVKGSRSHIRLNNLRQKMIFMARLLEQRYSILYLGDLTEKQIFTFFNEMRTGKIKRIDGKEYQSVSDFVKSFKSFWHRHMKVNKKNGNEIEDITSDLDTSHDKPRWVYLTEEQIKRLCDNAKFFYKILIMFLFDSGIRSPSELVNTLTPQKFRVYV